jgi:hypothetical protein
MFSGKEGLDIVRQQGTIDILIRILSTNMSVATGMQGRCRYALIGDLQVSGMMPLQTMHIDSGSVISQVLFQRRPVRECGPKTETISRCSFGEISVKELPGGLRPVGNNACK